MDTAVDVWQHRYVISNNIRLHYVIQGAGDLVVLLHGLPEFWYSWRHQIPALARRFTVVVPDLRGFNDSDKPVNGYELDTLVADLQGVIASLGYSKAHIVGHDWGGAIAWRFAQEFPQMLDRLAVLSLPCPQAPLSLLSSSFDRLRRVSALLGLHWENRSTELQSGSLPANFQAKLQTWVAQLFREQSVRQAAFSAEDTQLYQAALSKPGALTALVEHYRQCLSPQIFLDNLWKMAKDPESPTLVLFGADDSTIDQSLWQNVKQSIRVPLTLKSIAHCGHWIQQEAPQTVNRELLAFLMGRSES